MFPDWLITLIVTAIVAPIITAIIAPVVVARLQRRRDNAVTDKTAAEAEKVRAETRLLEISELEARVQAIVDGAVHGTTDLMEQLRGQVIDQGNELRQQDLQIAQMSETISSAMWRIRELETVNKSVEEANLKLLQRVDELEEQVRRRDIRIDELLARIEELEHPQPELLDGVITP